MEKDVLIGIFIRKGKILSFLDFLKRKIHLNLDKVFIYNIEENDLEYLLTFKTNNKKKYLHLIHYSTVMHVKNKCIFSINALNKYIEEKIGEVNKEYQIEWEKLENKLIILTSGELKIKNIQKIEDKTIFFN